MIPLVGYFTLYPMTGLKRIAETPVDMGSHRGVFASYAGGLPLPSAAPVIRQHSVRPYLRLDRGQRRFDGRRIPRALDRDTAAGAHRGVLLEPRHHNTGTVTSP